jgi:hypothetical protein
MAPIVVKRAPPVVGQGSDAKCWAAAMESWLRVQVAVDGPRQGKMSADGRQEYFGMPNDRHLLEGYSWLRKSATVQELLDTYSEILLPNGGLIRGEALEQVAADNGMHWTYLDILSFNKDRLLPLMSSCGHLLIVYFSFRMYHAIVGYGFNDDGVLVMNPSEQGQLKEIRYGFLRDDIRVNQPIFVGWPEKGNPLTVDHSVQSYLQGEWHVLIGPGGSGWTGYFGFSPEGDVYWRTFDQSVKHRGRWRREGMNVTWQFSDDDPAWMRTFKIQIRPDNTISDRMEGTANTQRGTMGFFTMTRTDD